MRAGGCTLSQAHATGTEVLVDTWTYNRGPYQFMMRIGFVNGKIVAITTVQEYGH